MGVFPILLTSAVSAPLLMSCQASVIVMSFRSSATAMSFRTPLWGEEPVQKILAINMPQIINCASHILSAVSAKDIWTLSS
jgi:hypothetical protein